MRFHALACDYDGTLAHDGQVDDATWTHHLEQGDYSRWLREAVKDEGLAEDAERVERGSERDPRRTRELLREAIERRYTAPA